MKSVLFGNEARQKLLKGVDLIANSIKVTLGPRGRNVTYGHFYGFPIISKDGVTIAQQVEAKDPFEQLGLLLIREVAQKTADSAGDGTTTASVVAQAVFSEGLKVLGGGANPILVKRGIDDAASYAISFIKKHTSLNPSEDKLIKIASISANNDPMLGKVICDAVKIAGKDGVVTIEDNIKDATTYIESVVGMRLNEGFFSPYFVTDPTKMEAVYQDPLILIADYEINHIQPLMKAVDIAIGQQKRPLIIIANNITGQALQTLVMNKHKSGLPILACKAPYFGDNRTDQLTDLAMLTGGRVIGTSSGVNFENIELSDFGRAENVTATKTWTTISGGKGESTAVNGRISMLQSQVEKTESDYEKAKLQERLAKLTSGVAVIKVGAATEVELKEKKMRVEDALHATQAALEEGIVPGGGVMLLRAAKALEKRSVVSVEDEIGQRIVVKALQEPIKQIAANAGVDGSEIIAHLMLNDNVNHGFDFLNNRSGDLIELGVIDPAKVVRLTIENGVSVAGMLLTTEAIICDDREEEYVRTPRPKE